MSATLSLPDLATWSFRGTALAVLGQPIEHSISPAMHNAALAALAVTDDRFASWRYFRFEIAPDELPEALPRFHAAGFHGLNLTVPHKILACDCIERIDTSARPAGAVNTLRRTPTGWEGFNTDGYGLAAAVAETLRHQLADRDIILLGAGGAARGAAVECLQRGCRSLAIGNRTAARTDALCAALQPLAPGIPVRGFDPATPPRDLPRDALVINATSAGLKPEDAAPVDLRQLPVVAAVYDMIYNPPLTPLLAQAKALGVPQANGLSMLVYQGARALELWTGAEAPVEVMLQAARSALQSR